MSTVIIVKTDNLELAVEVAFYEGELDTYELVAWSCHCLADLAKDLADGEYTLADVLEEEWTSLSEQAKQKLIIGAL